jgi:hypothetical protein
MVYGEVDLDYAMFVMTDDPEKVKVFADSLAYSIRLLYVAQGMEVEIE